MLTFILEAALRSALVALAVWASIRIFRVHHVVAQKVAWVLVLAAAAAMPLVMHRPWIAFHRAVTVPVDSLSNRVPDRISVLAGRAASLLTLPATPVIHNEITSQTAQDSARQNVTLSNNPAASFAINNHQLSAGEIDAVQTLNLHRTRDYTLASEQIATLSRQINPKVFASESVTSDIAAQSLQMQSQLPPLSKYLPNPPQIRRLIVALYLTIGAFFLLRIFIAAAIAHLIWRRSQPIQDVAVSGFQARGMIIRVSADLRTPVTIGSTIMLPIDYPGWSESKLRIVLTHEQSHVRQGDFYIQIAAALHAAIFWFSPLGWWLQRKLSDLGEALSDCAGLAQASNRAAYAQILLDFAATPKASPFSQPIAGVAMARANNISHRIDRILSDRRFTLSFLGGRRHVLLAALLVPSSLIAVVAGIRVVPTVEAAHIQDRTDVQATSTDQATRQSSSAQQPGLNASSWQASNTESTQSATTNMATQHTDSQSSTASDQVDTIETVPTTDSTIAPAPAAPAAPEVAAPKAPQPPEETEMQEPAPPAAPVHNHEHSFAAASSIADADSFAILSGKDSEVTLYGYHNKDFEEARKNYHNNFIWFERDGKSYVITDPAIVAQSKAMFKQNPALKLRQEELQKMQSKLDAEMKKLQPEIDKARLPGPEFQQQIAQLNAELAQLQSDKFKHLTEDISKQVTEHTKATDEMVQKITQEKMEKLGQLQERIGDIQGLLGEIQGKIGEREGRMGEKQGEIGERLGKIGKQMGEIGEEQGTKAEEASRKMKSIFDQAVRDGKAKPVD